MHKRLLILLLLWLVIPLGDAFSHHAAGAANPDIWSAFIITQGDQLHPVNSYRPAIYENKVAYIVDDYEELLFNLVAVQDLNTGETRVLADELPGGTAAVSIYGDWIVTVHDAINDSLHAYNLLTDEDIVIDPGSQFDNYYPDIDSNRIVWVRVDGCCSSDILLYDLTTRTITPITDDGGANYEYETDISDDWVVWYQGIYPEVDVMAYNLTTGERLPITDQPGPQGQAHIDQNIVVWTDVVTLGYDADIMGYDLNTRQTFPVAVGPVWQGQPYVHDGLITWVQVLGQVDHNQIWGQDVGGSDRFLVYDDCPLYNYDCPTQNGGPVSYSNLVVWIEDNSANNQLILTLRGARRLTQQTFLPLARH